MVSTPVMPFQTDQMPRGIRGCSSRPAIRRPSRRPRAAAVAVAVAVVLAVLSTACSSGGGGGLPVVGASRVSAGQLAGWYSTKGSGGSATVPVEWLAYFFIAEGEAEGVAGDVAFVQAMIETGWLRFSKRMPPEANNFSGIGAVDGGSGAAWFPSAQIGVRAQIQHLRAYADPNADPARLALPLVDPRFHLVTKGVAPTWQQFGHGVWATDPDYASKISRLYSDLLAYAAAHPDL